MSSDGSSHNGVIFNQATLNASFPRAQVCNHKNLCQCEPGWMPPDCTSVEGSSSAITSRSLPNLSVCLSVRLSDGCVPTEVVIGVVVALVILGVVAAVAALLWRRRSHPT